VRGEEERRGGVKGRGVRDIGTEVRNHKREEDGFREKNK